MKNKIRVLSVAVLLAITSVTVTACSNRKQLNFTEKIHVFFSGIDGEGEAEVYFDNYDAYDVVEQLYLKGTDVTRIENVPNLVESLDVTLDKTSGLSNGDEIIATLSYNKDFAKSLKWDITPTTKTFIVEGLIDLSKLTAVDPFEKLEVTFSGDSGEAVAEVKDNNEIDGLYFTVDKLDNLSNGDEITITAEFDEEYLIYEGYTVTETSKKYKVEGLSEYVSSLDQISEDLFNRMDQEARDNLAAEAARKWTSKLISMDLVNEYLLVKKEGYDGDENRLYMVYEARGEHPEYGGFKFYWYAGFKNIIKTGNICSTDLTDIHVPEGDYSLTDNTPIGEAFLLGNMNGFIWYVVGYKTESDLRYYLIDTNVAQYNYDVLK